MMLLSSSRKNCLISFLRSKSRFFRNFSDNAVSSLNIVVRSQIKVGLGFSISIFWDEFVGWSDEEGGGWLEEGGGWLEE